MCVCVRMCEGRKTEERETGKMKQKDEGAGDKERTGDIRVTFSVLRGRP